MDTFFQDAVCLSVASILTDLKLLSNGKTLQYNAMKKNKNDRQSVRRQTSDESHITENQLSDPFVNIIKIQNDLLWLSDVISKTLIELKDTGKFQTLSSVIDTQTRKKNEEESLISQHKMNMSDLKSLELQLANFKSNADTMLLEKSEMLRNLKSQWRIVRKVNDLETELVKKWEEARFTQATIFVNKDEETLEKKISHLVHKVSAEKQASHDIQTFINDKCETYKKLIETWKERYAKEMSMHMKQINETEKQLWQLDKIREKHMEIYNNRIKFIEECLKEKAERERLLELERKRIQSAIRIQAWWRGVMVRRCLGPYRKKSKKGKKAKKRKS